MRATHAHGFLPCKVSLLCGSNDGIQAFSPENRNESLLLCKGRFFSLDSRFLPSIHMNKNQFAEGEESEQVFAH
jgi:hypothetical protein